MKEDRTGNKYFDNKDIVILMIGAVIILVITNTVLLDFVNKLVAVIKLLK
jgi:hypothetical protein